VDLAIDTYEELLAVADRDDQRRAGESDQNAKKLEVLRI
jgi:hypothetical protein